MQLTTQAIIVAVRAHGEHGAIVRALTPANGVRAGYVRGGKSRRLRPVLVPGNLVQAEYRARTDAQLAFLSVEMIHSRAFLLSEPLAAAGIEWSTALTAAALPEGQPYPRLYQGLDGLLAAIEAAPSARGWAAGADPLRAAAARRARLRPGRGGAAGAAAGARRPRRHPGLDRDRRGPARHRPLPRPRPPDRPPGRNPRRPRAADRAAEAHGRLTGAPARLRKRA